MDEIARLMAENGIRPEGATLRGTMALRFRERREAFHGKVDAYEPFVSVLSVEGADGSAVAVPEGARESFLKAAGQVVSLPLWETVVKPGEEAPSKTAGFALDYVRTATLVRIDDELMDALIDGDTAKSADLHWERFKLSAPFAEAPCDRGHFQLLHWEFVDSRYLTGMGFGDYYRWHVRSAANVGADGALTPEAEARAVGLVNRWIENGDTDAESLSSWTNRNLKVHPRHRHLYDEVVEQRLAAAGPRP